MNTVGPRIWLGSWKFSKMRHTHCFTWNMDCNTQKRGKWEIHTVGPGIWQKAVKNVKNGNTHCRTWIMSRKLKNVKNEIQTLDDMIYGEKTEKTWKMRKSHGRTKNRARNTEKTCKMRETHCRTWNMVRNSEKVEKWEIHTVGTGVWREHWKSWKMRNTNCSTWNTARKSVKPEKWEIHK